MTEHGITSTVHINSAATYVSHLLPVVTQLGLGATLLFAHDTVAAQGDIASDPVVHHGCPRPTFTPHHNLLAQEMAIRLLQALFINTHPAATAESSLEYVLRTDAAIGGLAEKICILPIMLALVQNVLHQSLPPRSPKAAPQGDQDGQSH